VKLNNNLANSDKLSLEKSIPIQNSKYLRPQKIQRNGNRFYRSRSPAIILGIYNLKTFQHSFEVNKVRYRINLPKKVGVRSKSDTFDPRNMKGIVAEDITNHKIRRHSCMCKDCKRKMHLYFNKNLLFLVVTIYTLKKYLMQINYLKWLFLDKIIYLPDQKYL